MQSVTEYRPDCADRYAAIKRMCDFTGKSLIDIGCANGYFISMFLEDGGKSAVGVEPDSQYSGDYIVRDISEATSDFDICFYLDLHYHDGINYLPWIKSHAKELFIAPSGAGNNKRLEDELNEFGNFEFIHSTSYAGRNIYRVYGFN